MAFPTGWTYYKTHTVAGSAVGEQTNYTVPITVNYAAGADSGGTVYVDGKCNADFSDIRFTDSTGATELDYWMEIKTDSDNAIFWVEIPIIPVDPGTVNIRIYYGNAVAVTTSSVTAAMLKGWAGETETSGALQTVCANGYDDMGLIKNQNGIATYNGKTYIAWADDAGNYQISVYNQSTGIVTGPYFVDRAGTNYDDAHYHIGICIDRNGYIHAFYDAHGSALHYRRSTNAEDPSAWLLEHTVDTVTTYRIPFIIDNNGSDRLCCITRTDNGIINQGAMTFAYTDDLDGVGVVFTLVEIINTGNTDWVYPVDVAIGTEAINKVHFIFNWRASETSQFDQVCYMMSNDAGATWCKGDQSTAYVLPVTQITAEKISSDDPASAASIALKSNGAAVIIWNDYLSGDDTIPRHDISLYFSTYSGGWNNTIISTTNTYHNQANGWISIDPADDTHWAIFASTYAAGELNLYKLETADSGTSFTETKLDGSWTVVGTSEVISINRDLQRGLTNYYIGYTHANEVRLLGWPTAISGEIISNDFQTFLDEEVPATGGYGIIGLSNRQVKNIIGNYSLLATGTKIGSQDSNIAALTDICFRAWFYDSIGATTPAISYAPGIYADAGVNCLISINCTTFPAGTKYSYIVNGGAWTESAITRSVGWHYADFIINASGIIMKIDGTQIATAVAPITLTRIRIGNFSTITETNYPHMYVDNCFVRKYVNPEPTNGDWGSETAVGASYNVSCSAGINLSAQSSEVADFVANCLVTMNLLTGDSESAEFPAASTAGILLEDTASEQAAFIRVAGAGIQLDQVVSEIADFIESASAGVSLSALVTEISEFVRSLSAGITLSATCVAGFPQTYTAVAQAGIILSASCAAFRPVSCVKFKFEACDTTFIFKNKPAAFKFPARPAFTIKKESA